MILFRRIGIWCALPLLTACSGKPSTPSILRDWGVDAASAGRFKLVQRDTLAGHDSSSGAQMIVARTDDGFELRGEHYPTDEAAQADSYLRARVQAIMRIYDTRPEPYQGTVTRQIECPKKFQPVLKTGEPGREARIELKLYASANRVFGACSEDSAAFHVSVIALHCPKLRAVNWIEYFSPVTAASTTAPVAVMPVCAEESRFGLSAIFARLRSFLHRASE